jgi:hypothetical protein
MRGSARHAGSRVFSALAAAAALLLAGAGYGGETREGGPVAAASCADVLEWEGARYLGHTALLPVRPAVELGTATRLGCDDGHGASPDVEVPVATIHGVDPEVALVAPEDAWALWVREGHPLETGPLAPPLERALFGPRCGAGAPFVLEGALVGTSNLDEPFSVSIDVDETIAHGRPYLGLPIALLVRQTTRGLHERDDFRPKVGEEWRLRATVSCLGGERPTHTFAALAVERVEEAEPPADLGRFHCPNRDGGPPCEDGAEVGVWYPYDLYGHCRVGDAYFDGRWWLLPDGLLEPEELRPDLSANHWVRGLIALRAEDEAEFKGGGLRLMLVPAPDGYDRAACD